MMTLNEAIEYYDSLAEECRRKASIERNDYMDLRDESAEYSQLSEWLAELAVLREKVNCSEFPNNSDLISRQAAIDVLDVLCQEHRYRIPGEAETYSSYNEAWQDVLGRAENAIGNLPSAQPERKTGHWTKRRIMPGDPFSLYIRDCTECGGQIFEAPTKFCPYCGAKMEGELIDGDV